LEPWRAVDREKGTDSVALSFPLVVAERTVGRKQAGGQAQWPGAGVKSRWTQGDATRVMEGTSRGRSSVRH
jgi:hypothetical protein